LNGIAPILTASFASGLLSGEISPAKKVRFRSCVYDIVSFRPGGPVRADGAILGSKILVVDDDLALRDIVCKALGREGFPAEGADDGVEALDRVRSGQFDLVLLDSALAKPNGLAILDRFRALPRPPRTIVMTDNGTEEVLRAGPAQACRYITKPIAMHVLVELVREVLELGAEGPPIEVVSRRPDWVELLVPCTIEAAERSESFLAATRSDLPADLSEALSKAVHELVLNAVEWGGRLDQNRHVRIACVRTPRMILYRIADPGTGFDAGTLAHAAVGNPPDQPAEHQKIRAEMGLRPGGFGILMAQALADELVYNESHNEVILIKYLR
jgi:DNA-binding response OmpR family regulator